MKTAITIFLSLIINSLTAQNINLEFAKSSSDDAAGFAHHMKQDLDGNMYIIGFFGHYNDTILLDQNDSSSAIVKTETTAYFIEKQDVNGNFLWATSFGELVNHTIVSFDIDHAGNIYITGNFSDTVDFDPGQGSHIKISQGQSDMFILKLDSNGNFEWVNTYGDQYGDYAGGVSIDPLGNVIFSGSYAGNIDFDNGPNDYIVRHNSGTQMFVLKLNPNGSFIWVKSFQNQFNAINGLTGHLINKDITTNSTGDLFLTGYFWRSVDIDCGLGTTPLISNGEMDVYVLKMSTDGDFIWGKSMGAENGDMGISIAVDENDEVYSTGFFRGKPDFDPGANEYLLYAKKETDIFLQKLDKDGNFLWAKSIGGAKLDYGHRVVADNFGGVYLTGSFELAPDFNTGSGVEFINSKGKEDFCIIKHTSTGEYLWTQTFGGQYDDHAKGIAIYHDTNIYIAGNYHSQIDLDPRQANHHYFNASLPAIFTAKYTQCSSAISHDTIFSCGNYTWINGRTYRSSIERAYHTIVGGAMNGCDSVVVLNLNITANSSVTITDTSITSNAMNATYQWLDCANNYSLIANETNKVLELSHGGNYAVEVTKNGCVDTSACVFIGPIGIEEQLATTDFKVFPNPSSGPLQIEFNSEGNYSIIIYSITGHQIYERTNISQNHLSIDINTSPGVYIIKASSELGSTFQKVIFK